MYLATKYASQVLNISIDALKKSAQRGDKYPFKKLNNKLLFKVSTEQLLDALDKGLIDVNTPIFNDDLTLNQDFFKNLRRVNANSRTTTQNVLTNEQERQAKRVDFRRESIMHYESIGEYTSIAREDKSARANINKSNSITDKSAHSRDRADNNTTRRDISGIIRLEEGELNGRTNQELARAITSNSSTIREQGDRQRKADRNVLSARVGYGVSNNTCKGELNGRANFTASTSIGIYGDVCCSEGSICELSKSARFVDRERNTNTCGTSVSNDYIGRDSRDCLGAVDEGQLGEVYSMDKCGDIRLGDGYCIHIVQNNGCRANSKSRASANGHKNAEKIRGAVDDNTTNYNANNQCDNKSLLSNENNKNEIKDSITSARANKTMSQKYKNETTNSEIYEQINKQRIKNDDRKNPQDLSHSKADERLSRANRNSKKAEISKTTDRLHENDRGYRCEDDGTREIRFGISKALSTTNESKKYTGISTSQTDEPSTLNECLNERESFLLENNLSHTHASLSTFLKANAKSQEIALARVHVVKEYLKLKGKIKVSEFIDLINARGILNLSQRKLFLWQKAYLNGGLDALIPQYKNTKKTTLEELGLKEFFENALISEKGRINLANVYKLVHYEASARNLISLDDFLAKKDELVSYASIKRAANAFFKNNKLLKDLILYGEDGCTSRHLPALGVSNWAVNSINQIVEIDASPLDAICNTTDIATRLGIDAELVSSWQKRYCIISLIDTYSGVVSFYLGESENSQTIARAIAKYIKLYGKPKCIHSDNGKAFLSKHIKGMLERLDIEYKAMPAYSGWCKPYVENKFKALQNSLTANLSGYIGANVGQRQAIEFFMSKKERRLKKGMKTNLAKLKDLEYMQNIIDDFTNKFLNNTFLDRLQSTPNEAYMKKQDEAICIDELSLSMYLGGSLEYRNVSSKGISLNGQIYQNPKLYNYESVYVCASLNNVSQIFCFDEQKELICVAVLIDPVVGVSVEEAKQARKLYIKALKQNKEKISKARDERERMFERYIELGKETLNSITPNPTYTNDRLLEELEYANMLVSGSDVSVKKSNVKSWEDFV